MADMRFKVGAHAVRHGVEVVEVWNEGEFVAQIVPAEDGRSIKIISKYATGEVVEDNRPPNVALDGRRVRAFVVMLGD